MQSYFGGFPSPAQDHAEAPISLDVLLDIQAPHVYIVRASGNSMIGAGIYDGDWLIIDRSLTARHGHIIIAALHGEPLVRRLYCPDSPTAHSAMKATTATNTAANTNTATAAAPGTDANTNSAAITLQLHADNPLYRPIHLNPDDDFYIWGVVRHSVRRHQNSGGLHSMRTHTDPTSAASTATNPVTARNATAAQQELFHTSAPTYPEDFPDDDFDSQ